MRNVIIASILLWSSVASAVQGVSYNITRRDGTVIGYHVLDEKRVIITPLGDIYRFVDSYIDQNAYQSGKTKVQTAKIKLDNTRLINAINSFLSSTTADISANKAEYLNQIDGSNR